MADRIALELKAVANFGNFALDVDHVIPFEGVSALFGASGSGKTTLLRIIAGLEIARGRIAFQDELWMDSAAGHHVPPNRRKVGLVFQDARLFEHLDVAGNLRFGMKAGHMSDSDYADVCARLDLAPLVSKRVGALSGGERQRVALGRALLAAPELLLLDEPLGALDGRRKREILPYLQRLATDFGVPTLFVSHSIEEVSQLASHLTLLDGGKIVAAGPTEEMMERPDLQSLTGRFEAGSTLQARVVNHDRAFHLTRLEVAGQALVMPMLDRLEIGSKVPLRVRARDVALSNTPMDGISIRNQLKGQIAEIYPEEDTAFAEVVVDLGGTRIRSRVTRLALSDLKLAQGADVIVLVKSVAFDRRGLLSR